MRRLWGRSLPGMFRGHTGGQQGWSRGTRDRRVICEVREMGGLADYVGVSVSS